MLIESSILKAKIIEGCKTCPNNGTTFCKIACEIDWIMKLIDNAPTKDEKSYAMGYQDGLEDGLHDIRPRGKWIYPYYDNFIGKRRIGKSVRECSICNQIFGNNIPWNAKFCPNCGANIEENNDAN